MVSPNHFDIIGALGIANLNDDSTELGVTRSETDKLNQTNNDSWNTFAAELGVGYVSYFGNAQQYSDMVQLFPSMEPQLNVYYLNNNKGIQGDVWRFNNAAFNDLSYNMPISSVRLMLDLALTVASWRQLSIYGIGGLGEAWNRSSYSDRDKSSVPCPEQRLSLGSVTSANFAWEAGAGLAFAFNERVALSLEYLYADLGTVRASRSGHVGTITAPVISSPNFDVDAQSFLLALHIAL